MKNHRIVLVGFMGCGKTTVAKELARALNCDFVDLDTVISESRGQSPAEIIQQDGESAFREIETGVLGYVLGRDGARVVALGGGSWVVEKNRSLVSQHGFSSVWLDAPFELCWKRITGNQTVRPLAPDMDTALKLYSSRLDSYHGASIRVTVDEADSAASIASGILDLLAD
jgi:shikimate kinase